MLQRWIAALRKTARWKAFIQSVPTGMALGGIISILLGTAGLFARKGGLLTSLDRASLLSFTSTGVVVWLGGVYWRNTRETRGRLNWLTYHANWAAHQIRLHGLGADSEVKVDDPSVVANRWPWGSHHTEMLGHVEAAATKWWANYDPTSPDTAPTNDMVSEWLCNERDVSKDKAKAIASILRADGLRTGPRR